MLIATLGGQTALNLACELHKEGVLAVKNPIIGRQQLQEALKAIYPDYQNCNGNKDIDTQLVNSGVISEQKLIELYSEIFDIPLFDEENLPEN